MNHQSKINGIILLAFGLILFIFPGGTLRTLCQIIGWCLLAGGLLEIITGYIGVRDFFTIACGTVAFVAGLIFVFSPSFIISLLPTAIGLAVVVGALVYLIPALMVKAKDAMAYMTIVGSVIALVAGFIILINPYSTVKLITAVLGAVLIYFGIVELLHK